MSRAIAIIRRLSTVGRHLYEDFAEPQKRSEGWRMMQRANRIARRLGYPTITRQ